MQEAALRWAFVNAETDLHPPAAYCIGLWTGPSEDYVDPSRALLDRFAADPIPVRPLSHCQVLRLQARDQERHSVLDPQTGRPGLLFTLGPIEWTEAGAAARVHIAYLQGALWGRGWRCEAERTASAEWSIARCVRVADV